MTPDNRDQDIQDARHEANKALEHARERRALGSTLAAKWRQSREDNNFRAMLRSLTPGEGS